jgi:secreted trypsin-like serine protease
MQLSGFASVAGALALATMLATPVGAQGMKAPSARKGHEKVFFGQDAPPGAFPFQVGVIRSQDQSKYLCGGSLIADTWVLTAGHCVSDEEGELVDDPPAYTVYAGSITLQGGDRIAVKSVHRHPQYDKAFLDNDVALLQLERAPKKEFHVAPINLIDSTKASSFETVGTDLIILGWGNTETGSPPKNLRYTSIKMVDRGECSNNIIQARAKTLDDSKAMQEIIFQYKIDQDKIKNIHDAIVGNAGRVVNDNMICAGDPNPPPGAEFTRDTCQGDSGGPLVAKAGGKPIQVGIVSWGHGCGLPKVYGVYTRLGNFIDWIRSVTK